MIVFLPYISLDKNVYFLRNMEPLTQSVKLQQQIINILHYILLILASWPFWRRTQEESSTSWADI